MAKEWAKPFYNSVEWTLLRLQVLRKSGRICEMCGGYATEVHHEIELTRENIGDPKISLNPRLLHCLCHDCHTAITGEQKGKTPRADCADGFFFDENGVLTPRGVVK